jgi:mannose-6-phosphate isomerase-like protein (cupin superfamily)
MQYVSTMNRKQMFAPLLESDHVQSAVMILQQGESSSNGVENEHPLCEQWVYLISGSGEAEAGDRTIELPQGSLLLIEKHEPHRITNTGKIPLVTLNFYSPPAYTRSGDVRQQARVT